MLAKSNEGFHVRCLTNQVLDETGLVHMSATAEFDADVAPLRVLGVLEKLIHVDTNGDYTNGVRIGLTEDGANTLNLACMRLVPRNTAQVCVTLTSEIEIDILVVDLGVLLDVLVRQILNLLDLRERHLGLVTEIEPQLILVDQRALLVDLIAENLPQRMVEDVRAGVVVADRCSPQLVCMSRLAYEGGTDS